MKFNSTPSTFVSMLTLAGNLIGFTFLAYNISNFEKLAPHIKFLGIYLTAFLLIILFLIRPYQFVIAEHSIIIKRHIFPINIPFESITSISQITRADLHGSIRLFASGGFWGYIGIFKTFNYGKVRMHCSNIENLVLIETTKRKYIISPDDVAGFVEAAQGLHMVQPA